MDCWLLPHDYLMAGRWCTQENHLPVHCHCTGNDSIIRDKVLCVQQMRMDVNAHKVAVSHNMSPVRFPPGPEIMIVVSQRLVQ